MGLYRATKLPAWSPAEVGQQPPAVRLFHHLVKTMWLNDLCCQVRAWWEQRIRASVWGRPIIARVMLREQLDREPTVAEVNSQVDKLKDGSVGLPPLGIIRAAFEAGDEVWPGLISRAFVPSGYSPTRTTENLPLETRMQGLRRRAPVGDVPHIPILPGGLSEEKECLRVCVSENACEML